MMCVCVWVCHAVLLERFFTVDLHESLFFVFLFFPGGTVCKRVPFYSAGRFWIAICQRSYFTMGETSPPEMAERPSQIFWFLYNDLWDPPVSLADAPGHWKKTRELKLSDALSGPSCQLFSRNDQYCPIRPTKATFSISRHQCCSKCISLCAWGPFNTGTCLSFLCFLCLSSRFHFYSSFQTEPEGTRNMYILDDRQPVPTTSKERPNYSSPISQGQSTQNSKMAGRPTLYCAIVLFPCTSSTWPARKF